MRALSTKRLARYLLKHKALLVTVTHVKETRCDRMRLMILGQSTRFMWRRGDFWTKSCYENGQTYFDSETIVKRMKDYDRYRRLHLSSVQVVGRKDYLWRRK